MIVSELEDLLALLPADMPIYIAGGHACTHITQVSKNPRQTKRPWNTALPGEVTLPDGAHPPALVLAGWGAPMWYAAWADEVPFEVTGRWPARPAKRVAR